MSKTIKRLLSNKTKILLDRCDAPTEQPASAALSKFKLLRSYRIPKFSQRPTDGEHSATSPPQLRSEEDCAFAAEKGPAANSSARLVRETSSPAKLSLEDALNASSAVINCNVMGPESSLRCNDGNEQDSPSAEEDRGPVPTQTRTPRGSDDAVRAKARQPNQSNRLHKKTTRRPSPDSLVKQSDGAKHESAKRNKRRSLQQETVSAASGHAETCSSKKKKRKSSSDGAESSSNTRQVLKESKNSSREHLAQSEATDQPAEPVESAKNKKRRRSRASAIAELPCTSPVETASTSASVSQVDAPAEESVASLSKVPSPEGISKEGAAEKVIQGSLGTLAIPPTTEEHCGHPPPPAEVQQQNPGAVSTAESSPQERSTLVDAEESTESEREEAAGSPEVPNQRSANDALVAPQMDNPVESAVSTDATAPSDPVSESGIMPPRETTAGAAEESRAIVDEITEEDCRQKIAEVVRQRKETENRLKEKRAAVDGVNRAIRQIEEELEARRNALAPLLAEEEEAAGLLHQSKQRLDQLNDSLVDKQRAEDSQMLELRCRQVAHMQLVIKGRENRDFCDPVVAKMIADAHRNVKDAEEQLKPILSDLSLLQSGIDVAQDEVKKAQTRKDAISAKLEVSFYSVRAALDESVKSKTGERQRLEDQVATLQSLLAQLRRQATEAKVSLENILHRKRLEQIRAEEEAADDEDNPRQGSSECAAKISLASFARAPVEVRDPGLSAAVDLSRSFAQTAGGEPQSSTAAASAQTFFHPAGFSIPWISYPANQRTAFSAPLSQQQQHHHHLAAAYAPQQQQQNSAWYCCFACSASCATRCNYCAIPLCWNRCMMVHKQHSHPNLP